MKKIKLLISVLLLVSIGVALIACEAKVNLKTEQEAINYLEDYIEKNDKWGRIADELCLYYTVKGTAKFNSTSFAKDENGTWLVVIHGSITGYTDYNQTQKGTFEFSYVAEVTTDGNVKELFIQSGRVTEVY